MTVYNRTRLIGPIVKNTPDGSRAYFLWIWDNEGSRNKADTLLQICDCGPAFSFASPKENAALVCGLGSGGLRISPRTLLKRPRKPLWFSWIFPAKTGRYAPKITFSCIPCLSLWERWLSEARSERVYAGRNSPKTLSVACGDSSPRDANQ